MTLDTIHSLIVTVTWVPIVIVFTSYITRMNKRIDTQEAEIRQLCKQNKRLIDHLCDSGASITTNALAICDNSGSIVKISDDLAALRREYLAQARALDAHDDRLSALEGEQ